MQGRARVGRRRAGSIWRAAALAPSHLPVGVEAQQAVAIGVRGLARQPGQFSRSSSAHGCASTSAFSMLRADALRQVPQLRPLRHVDAGQVEHADAAPVRAEQRRAGAAVDAGVVEEMLAAVQPDRLPLGQRRADGGGADGALGQVDADAGDVAGVRGRPRSGGAPTSITMPSASVRIAK